MQPGTYYTEKLNAKLVAADKVKAEAEKEFKEYTREKVRPALCEQLGVKAIFWDNNWKESESLDCSYVLDEAQKVHVTPAKMGGPIKAWFANQKRAHTKAKEACAARCKIADLLENQAIRKFTARVRATYGNRKEYSQGQLDAVYKEITAPLHACVA